MSTSYSNYIGLLITVNKNAEGSLDREIKTCLNENCSCHKKKMETNFCSECGTKIDILKFKSLVPVDNYISSKRRNFEEKFNKELYINIINLKANKKLIYLNKVVMSYSFGTICSLRSVDSFVEKGKQSSEYKELIKWLEEGGIDYTEEVGSILLAFH